LCSQAAAAARLRTPLAKADPNAVRKKVSPEVQNRIRKRLREETAPAEPREKTETAPAVKRPKILGGLDLQSEEVQKMLKARSSHRGVVAEVKLLFVRIL